MQSVSLKKIIISTLIISAGMLISVDWSTKNSISIASNSAYAIIGRPATPGSVAGVNRRAVRRNYYYNNNYYNNRYYY